MADKSLALNKECPEEGTLEIGNLDEAVVPASKKGKTKTGRSKCGKNKAGKATMEQIPTGQTLLEIPAGNFVQVTGPTETAITDPLAQNTPVENEAHGHVTAPSAGQAWPNSFPVNNAAWMQQQMLQSQFFMQQQASVMAHITQSVAELKKQMDQTKNDSTGTSQEATASRLQTESRRQAAHEYSDISDDENYEFAIDTPDFSDSDHEDSGEMNADEMESVRAQLSKTLKPKETMCAPKQANDVPVPGPSRVQDADNSVDVLGAMAQLFQMQDDTGPAVSTQLANVANAGMRSQVSSTKIKEITEKYPRPQNCEKMTVPRVNGELWDRLRKETKANDVKLQHQQQMVIKAMVPVLRIMDKMISEQGAAALQNENFQWAGDAFTLMCHLSADMSQRRRNMIKPDLSTQFKRLCGSQNQVTDFLFGDDLTKQIKDINEAQRVGMKMSRPSQFQQHRLNTKPYSRGEKFRHSRPFLRGGKRQAPWRPKKDKDHKDKQH